MTHESVEGFYEGHGFMNATDLYVFSGTGNTLRAARAMAERLGERGIETRLLPMERSDPAKVDLDRTLGLACPVSAQSTYPLVWDFARRLPQAVGTEVFLVDTLQMFSGGILGPMRRCLAQKGYRPLGALEIRMPGNLFRKRLVPEAEERVIQAGLEKARAFADDLAAGRTTWRPGRVWEWLFYGCMRSAYGSGFMSRAARFNVKAESCTKCGLCQRLCPVGAIRMGSDGLPQWGPSCNVCLRCFSYCPTGAIRMGRGDFARHRAVKASDFLESWETRLPDCRTSRAGAS